MSNTPATDEHMRAELLELALYAGSCAEGPTDPEFSQFLHIEAKLRNLAARSQRPDTSAKVNVEALEQAMQAGLDEWRRVKAIDHAHGADPECERCIRSAMGVAYRRALQSPRSDTSAKPLLCPPDEGYYCEKHERGSRELGTACSECYRESLATDTSAVELVREYMSLSARAKAGLLHVGILNGVENWAADCDKLETKAEQWLKKQGA